MEIIIKLDHDEPVKVNTASIYGEKHPLPDWDPEALQTEIQDLKMENDRLKQRNDLMLSFLNAMCCIETDIPCMKCMFGLAGGCTLKSENYEKEALKIIKKLEAL